MGNEIDRLEIAIETEAKNANRSLSTMERHLNKIADDLEKVVALTVGLDKIGNVDFGGLKSFKSEMDSIFKTQQKMNRAFRSSKGPRINRSDLKYTEKSLDNILEKYKSLGKGYDFSKLTLPELDKEIQKSRREVQRLQESLDLNVAQNEFGRLGKSVDSAAAKLQMAKNKAADLNKEFEKRKSLYTGNKSSGSVNADRQTNSDSDSEREEKFLRSVSQEAQKAQKELDGVAESAKRARKYTSLDIGKIRGLDNRSEQSQKQSINRQFTNGLLDAFKLDENGQLSNLKNLGGVFKSYMSGISKNILDGFKMNEDGTINGVEAAKRAFADYISTAKKAFSGFSKIPSNNSIIGASKAVDWDRFFGREKLDENIRQVQDQMIRLKNMLNEHLQLGKIDLIDDDIADMKILEKELKNLQKIRQSVYGDLDGRSLANTADALKQATKEGSRLSKVLSGIKGATKKINSAKSDIDGFRKAMINCRKAVYGMFHPLRTLTGLFSESGRSANKGMSFGRMLGSSVLFSFIFQAISAIQNAIKEGSDNLVQYSAAYNNSISSMVSSLLYLKNAWAAAFAPIVNVVAPYVSAFIDMLAGALNAVGQFMAALTGKGFAVQAKKVWKDYGASIADTGTDAGKAADGIADVGDSAKKAAKDLQSYTLGIDELNVIQPNLDNGSTGGGGSSPGSGSGGSGGTGGVGDLSPADMFETVEIDSSISKLADMFKEAIKTGDFTEIGSLLSDKLSDALESINWNSVYKKAAKFGTGLATFLNGLIKPRLFRNLGGTIAKAINTVLTAANTFANVFDWKNLGTSLASGIDQFFEDWDAGLTAETFSNFASGILEALTAAIETLGEEDTFSKIGQKLVDFFCGIKWADLAWDLTGFFDALGNAFVEFPMDFVKGVAAGILDKLFGDDIADQIEKKASTIFAPLETVWKQLFSGLTPVANAFSIISLVQDTIESGGENIRKFFESLWKSIQTIFSLVPSYFSEKFGSAKDAVYNAWQFVSSWFKEKVSNPISSTINNLKDSIKSAFKTAYEGAVSAWQGIESAFKSIANKAISPIGKLVNGIIDGVNWVSDKLGAGKILNNWSVPKFAKGTSGLSHDTIGMVNDQKGGTYKELIVPPKGDPFIPKGRNVMLPLQKGTKIMPAGQTKELMNNVPKFAGGIGDFFGNAWSAIRSFTGNVLDYISHPEDIVKIAIDKFTDMSSMFEPWTTIGAGIVNKLFDTIVKKIKYLFDKFSPAGVEKAIKWAVGIANDDSHGYDQASRWGNPDYDCSSLVISAFEQAGIKLKSAGATYTGNMYGAAKSAGFTDVTASANKATTAGMKRGDILLNRKHHTALYLGNGQIVQASSNEFGRATGGKPGDQTGREISVRSYYNYPWDDILRYVGKAYKEGVGKVGFFDIFKIPQLADGGVLSKGQMFVAREHGPELVGRQGNKSVVMNNDQIVKSVSTGVGSAVDNAITRLEARLQRLEEIELAILDKDTTINIDGKKANKQLGKARRSTGYNFSPA